MLETIRNHKSKLAGMLIAGFCAVLMVGFGVGTFDTPRNGPVATVDGQEISVIQLDRRLNEISSRLREQLGEHFSQFAAQLNLKQQALDSLITEILINKFTASLELTASSSQIEKKILASPYFRGSFSQAAFDGYLRATGMTAQQLEFRMRNDLVREQLTAIAKDLNVFTEAELRAAYERDHAKVSLNYLEISADNFKSKVDIKNETDIANFFAQNKESYQTPKQVRISYVEFKPEDYANNVEVAQEDAETAFRERQSEFFEPAQYHLRKILVAAPKEESKLPFELPNEPQEQSTPSDRDAKKKVAEELLNRLKAGEAFAAVATASSEDLATKANGGDLGWITEDSLAPAEKTAIEDLDVQEYSGVIDGPDGYSILFLEEAKRRQDKSFEQVKDIIISDLKRADAPMYAKISADEFKTKWDASGSPRQPLSEFAKSESKTLQTSGSLASNAPPAVPAELFQRALDLNEGDEEVYSVGDNTYLMVVDQVREPRIPELSEVREKVVQEFVVKRSRELAEQFANDLKQELTNSTIQEIATKHQLQVHTSDAVTREEAHTGVWTARGVSDVAFSLREDGTKTADKVFTAGRVFYLVGLAKRELPSNEDFMKSVATIRNERQSESGMRLLDALVSVLRADAKINVDNEMLDSV